MRKKWKILNSLRMATTKTDQQPEQQWTASDGPSRPREVAGGGQGCDGLWGKALERLPEADRMALAAYHHQYPAMSKSHLDHGGDGDGDNDDDGSDHRWRLLDEVLRCTERARDASLQRRWTVRWKGREIQVRTIAQSILRCIDQFKVIGDLLMQYDTTAVAIPWAAVRAVLQVLTLENDVAGIFLLGVERTSLLINKCLYYEHPNLTEAMPAAARQNFENALVTLYSSMLAFLVMAKKFFGRNMAGRTVQSISERQEIESLIDNIEWCDNQVYQLVVLRRNEEAAAGSALVTQTHFSVRQITDNINEMRLPVSRIELQLADLAVSQQGKRKGDILVWVSNLPYHKYLRQAFAGYLDGTGQWLLRTKKYEFWNEFHTSQILWLRGDPGTGKTKLTALVIRELNKRVKNSFTLVGLAFFFCNRSEPERREPESVWRSLVKQLCTQSELGFELVKQEYEAQERIGFADDALDFRKCQDILLELLSIFSHTILVIDALDECNESTRYRLLEALQELCHQCPGRISIFVSSRNSQDISLELKDVPNHYIESADNADDIEKYIHATLKDRDERKRLLRGKATQELKNVIAKELQQQAKGMFLYVTFSIDYLCGMTLESDIRERLGKLPDDMDQTYEVIYGMIHKQQRVARLAAETTIMWLMSAYRPLSPDEMFAALVYAGIEEQWDLEKLLEICQNLIVLDREQNVLRFTHLSAMEYLQKRDFSDHRIHAFVSEACLGILHCQSWQLQRRLRRIGNESLAQYAQLYWPFHTKLCEQERSEESAVQLQSFLGSHNTQNGPFVDWFSGCKQTIQGMNPPDRDLVKISQFIGVLDGSPVSPVVFATAFALLSYLKSALRRDQSLVDITNKAGQSLLMIAARLGHEDVVEILLEAKANIHASIDSDTCLYANALQAAAIGGQIGIAKILLRRGGIELDAPGGQYGYAAIAAAFYGHEAMVEYLVRNHGRTRSGRGGIGVGDALHAAARSGNESLLESLLDAGEDVNAEAGRYGTPLAWAVDRGSVSMVSLLLRRHANPNIKAGIYGSPLHLAALWGSEEIAKMLLNAGAHPNSYDGSMRTPFHESVTKCRLHPGLMQLLIRSGTNPCHLDDAGWSTRDEAVWRGSADIVRYLESLGITAEKDPSDCPLQDKSEAGLTRAALGEAFRDMQPGNLQWLEYALPIVRFSGFRLGLREIAIRAVREWILRWEWQCDGCHRNYQGESLHACTTCHSTNLCRPCFRLRRQAAAAAAAADDRKAGSDTDELSSPPQTMTMVVCRPTHIFDFVDIEGGSSNTGEGEDSTSVWDWMKEVKDRLQAKGHIPVELQAMLRFDKNRRTWAHKEHKVNSVAVAQRLYI